MWCKERAQPVSSESCLHPPGVVRLMTLLRLRSAMSSKRSTLCAVKGTTQPCCQKGLGDRRILLDWYTNYFCPTVLCFCQENGLMLESGKRMSYQQGTSFRRCLWRCCKTPFWSQNASGCCCLHTIKHHVTLLTWGVVVATFKAS
jgi:hypothetical protein